MNILVINVYFAPYTYGGATLVAEEVAKELTRKPGVAVTVVSAMSRRELQPYSIMKVEVEGINNYIVNVPESRSYEEIYNNHRVTEKIEQVIRVEAPDVVHIHCVQDIGAGLLDLCNRLTIPAIISIHDFWWICERQFMIASDGRYCGQYPVRIENCRNCVIDLDRARFRFDYLCAQARKANIITYPSRFARGLHEASGFPPDKGVVWENGVRLPAPEFFERQAERRRRDPRVSFGFVGGPSHIKGWPLLKQAFSSIEREDFVGYLVDGSLDGSWWNRDHLKTLRGDWKIHPKYSMDTMDDFFVEIDVILFLSQWKETYGLTIREALCRGIRVVQTDSGGAVEHAKAGEYPLIEIGADASVLIKEISSILDARQLPTRAVEVVTFRDQAQMFFDMVNSL